MKRYRYISASALALLACIALLVNSCKKDDMPPDNPYDDVDYSGNNDTIPVEPGTITWLHKQIFFPKCGTPGCHDGSFEPDFRTVMSSYATLVYHPIVKNNTAEEFTYRVIPGDTARSVLHERITNCCFVNINDRMPQDNIGDPLPDSDIQAIETWILDGAKDMFGGTPRYPNSEPVIAGYLALNSSFMDILSETNDRVDSVPYNPFVVSPGMSINIALQITDDSTATSDFSVNQLRISTDPDDFSSATTHNATYIPLPAPNPAFWNVSLNTSSFPTGTTLYMRYYVNDNDHSSDTHFPYDELPIQYKQYWSFRVE